MFYIYLLHLLLQLQFLVDVQVEGGAHWALAHHDRCRGAVLWVAFVLQVPVPLVIIGRVLQCPPVLQGFKTLLESASTLTQHPC